MVRNQNLMVTMLQNLDVPEVVAANLVGHRIATQTYGLYSQVTKEIERIEPTA